MEDYLPIHQFFDESKSHIADLRHRPLRHHSEGIFLCERVLGVTITNSDGRIIPTPFIGEQHVKEDLGWIPSLKDWFENIKLQPWMLRAAEKPTESKPRRARRPGGHHADRVRRADLKGK